MPEPSPSPGVAVAPAAPGLTIRLGPALAAGRGVMAPEELRALGIRLNGGRRRGWRQHLARLLATPVTTIAAWASRSPGNARPIPGAVAVAVRLMADIVRQTAAEGTGPREAAQALADRIIALACCPAQDWAQATLPGAAAAPPAAEASLLPPRPDAILVEPPQLPPGG